MALHPDVLAELEAASSARRTTSSADVPARINALEGRIVCLEAARRDNGNIYTDTKFWGEVTAEIRAFVEGHVNAAAKSNDLLVRRHRHTAHGRRRRGGMTISLLRTEQL